MEIIRSNSTKIVDVDFNSIKFGEIFTDHMFECNFKNGDWEAPVIKPYGSIDMDPSSHVFHYGQAVFEGMKGYKDTKDQLWLFRPKDNYERLKKSCVRMKFQYYLQNIFLRDLKN
jgi:branched-chain amino acid aminotransferase